MKITHEKENQIHLFEIENAGCFLDPSSDTYNIKTSNKNNSGDIGVVNLQDGDLFYENPKAKVVAVNADIVVRFS